MTERKSDGARIVSLDFCADQYVLALANPEDILALSPDATKSFSYLRERAVGYPTVRSSAEDVLLLDPDIVVRTYGGGAGATDLFERAGVDVVQIGYAARLDDVAMVTRQAARDLRAVARGEEIIAKLNNQRQAISDTQSDKKLMYLTSKGAIAGTQTIIDDLIVAAGHQNFQQRPGWSVAPMERLAYEQPDIIAAGFFETSDLVSDRWTPARHPVVKRALDNLQIIDVPGAWTACGGWFVMDAVEALRNVPS